jgi:carbamoyl-phosphate synthase small subunit
LGSGHLEPRKGYGRRKSRKAICMYRLRHGIKYNILRKLTDAGCRVEVVPATMSAAEVLAKNPDGIFLSNGPGDPAAVTYAIDAARELVGKKPIFGICLGHQILCLALGGRTYKLKYGHHGGNQPVMYQTTGKVEITSQNHGFAVDIDSFAGDVRCTHINLNDRTVEGRPTRNCRLFRQYHPEASPTARCAIPVRALRGMMNNR